MSKEQILIDALKKIYNRDDLINDLADWAIAHKALKEYREAVE